MDSLNMGVILLDKDGIIRMCNRRAEEITGISISAGESHPAGKIEDGDIVIIADSKMGEDDGNLSAEDLKMLNIKDGEMYFGDWKAGSIMNFPEAITVDSSQEAGFMSGSTVYRGMALVDGKPTGVKNALVKLVQATV